MIKLFVRYISKYNLYRNDVEVEEVNLKIEISKLFGIYLRDKVLKIDEKILSLSLAQMHWDCLGILTG